MMKRPIPRKKGKDKSQEAEDGADNPSEKNGSKGSEGQLNKSKKRGICCFICNRTWHEIA